MTDDTKKPLLKWSLAIDDEPKLRSPGSEFKHIEFSALATIQHNEVPHEILVQKMIYPDSPMDICEWEWRNLTTQMKKGSRGNLIPKDLSWDVLLAKVLCKVEDQLLTPMEQMSLSLCDV